MAFDTFNSGFGADPPSPREIGMIGAKLSVTKAERAFQEAKQTGALKDTLTATGAVADSIMERMGDAIYDPISASMISGEALNRMAIMQVIEHLQPVIAEALALGMPPDALPSMQAGLKRSKAARRRPRQPRPTEPPAGDNMLTDPQGPTPADPPDQGAALPGGALPGGAVGSTTGPVQSVQGEHDKWAQMYASCPPDSAPTLRFDAAGQPIGFDCNTAPPLTGPGGSLSGGPGDGDNSGLRLGGPGDGPPNAPFDPGGGGQLPVGGFPVGPIGKPLGPFPGLPEPILKPPGGDFPTPTPPVDQTVPVFPVPGPQLPPIGPLPIGKRWGKPPDDGPNQWQPSSRSPPSPPPPGFTYPIQPTPTGDEPLAPPPPPGFTFPIQPTPTDGTMPIQGPTPTPAPTPTPTDFPWPTFTFPQPEPLPFPGWPNSPYQPVPTPTDPSGPGGPSGPASPPPPAPPALPPGGPSPGPGDGTQPSGSTAPAFGPTLPGGTPPGQGAPIYVSTPAPVVNVSVQPAQCCGTAEIPVFEPAPNVEVKNDFQIQATAAPASPTPSVDWTELSGLFRERPSGVPCPERPPAAKISAECLPGWDAIGGLFQDSVYGWLCRHGLLGERGQLAPLDAIATTFHEKAKGGGWTAGLYEFVASVIATIGEYIPPIIQVLEEWSDFAAKLGGCADSHVALPLVFRWLIGVVERWIGTAPPQVYRAIDLWTNWLCPTNIPSQSEADSAWLGGTISDARWECLTRANDNKPEYAKQVRDAQLTHVSFDQAIALFRRGKMTVERLKRIAERSGIHTAADYVETMQSAEWVASPSDAIQWMLKDITDPAIVGRFDLGAEFERKYTGIVKGVFDANGMSRDAAFSMWLAHWRNMAPHALYEMHKRLRPGRFDALSDEEALSFARSIASDEQAQGITDIVAARTFLSTLTTGSGDLYEALGQADYPPFWRARLMAVSYSLLKRVDIRRAYETGSIDGEQLIALLQDRGYTETDARRLFVYFFRASVQLTSRRPAANQWVTDGYDTGLLKQALLDTGMREDQWSDVFAILETRRKILVQRKCLEQLHKGYRLRLMPDEEVYGELAKLGLNGPQQTDLIEAWACERSNTRREIQAAQLCKMFHQEIIDRKTFKARLKDLRYTSRQINDLVESCELTQPPKTWRTRRSAQRPIGIGPAGPAPEPSPAPGSEDDV